MNRNWISDISEAHELMKPHVLRTPLYFSKSLSELNEGEVYLKLESEQYTGSFKARGSYNAIAKQISQGDRHFITASTGNHAQGFARALEILGGEGAIYVPENTATSKLEAIRKYNIEIVTYGRSPLEAENRGRTVAERNGSCWVSPYNHPFVIAGQGTLAKEITEDFPEVEVAIGCVGGGGMMSGVGSWCKNFNNDIQVVGALPENSPEMKLSVEAGHIVIIDQPKDTLSDGSAGGLEEGSITFDICRQVIDKYLTVTENDIRKGIRWMAKNHHKMIEGAAAVALMAFINNASSFRGKKVAIVICGANIDTDKYAKIILDSD